GRRIADPEVEHRRVSIEQPEPGFWKRGGAEPNGFAKSGGNGGADPGRLQRALARPRTAGSVPPAIERAVNSTTTPSRKCTRLSFAAALKRLTRLCETTPQCSSSFWSYLCREKWVSPNDHDGNSESKDKRAIPAATDCASASSRSREVSRGHC